MQFGAPGNLVYLALTQKGDDAVNGKVPKFHFLGKNVFFSWSGENSGK